MPKNKLKKSTAGKRVTTKKTSQILTEQVETPEFSNEMKPLKNSKQKLYLKIGIFLALILLGYFLYLNKNFFLAGSVNGQMIFTSELNQKLKERYGNQVLEELINEKIVMSEASTKKIIITEKDIDKKVAELEKNLGGKASIEDLLREQGLTNEEFRKQIYIRLTVDKILEKKVNVTVKEINDYIAKNPEEINNVNATDSAAQIKYTKDLLSQQEMSAEFEKWFNDLRTKAKIQRYL